MSVVFFYRKERNNIIQKLKNVKGKKELFFANPFQAVISKLIFAFEKIRASEFTIITKGIGNAISSSGKSN
jgi:hypothetical protein